MNWRRTGRADPAMAKLADKHYSRQTVGSPQFSPPGQVITLIVPEFWPYKAAAGWVWHRPHPDVEAKRMDGFDGWHNCCFFRNESDLLSSELIQEAIGWADEEWGVPKFGYDTYVWPEKIQSSNPGYCYQKAGWTKAGWSKDGKKRRLVLARGYEGRT